MHTTQSTHVGTEVVQDLDLHQGLVVEALLVADHLERAHLVGLVVKHLHHLAEGALAQHAHHFEAVRDVVVHDDLVVAALVVKPCPTRNTRSRATPK